MLSVEILKGDFFRRKTTAVAQELLGKFLVRKTKMQELACMITEVEAYDGFADKASHAHRGKTMRNEVMFGPPGYWYIYLVYGMHQMLNIVTGEEGYPAAILIRAVEGMSGPGRVTKLLAIDHSLNKKPAERASGLWIEDRGVVIPKHAIEKTPRIGVAYAGPEWSQKPYRFVLKVKRGN